MSELDPHSTYIPRERVEEVNEPLDGSFEGVGIEYTMLDDTLTVQSVIVGGPAEAVGMRAGDKIIAVDGQKTPEWNDVIEVIDGYHEGDRIEIEYRRDGKSMEAFVTPEYNKEEQRYMVGIVAGISRNPALCLKQGVAYTWEINKNQMLMFG